MEAIFDTLKERAFCSIRRIRWLGKQTLSCKHKVTMLKEIR